MVRLSCGHAVSRVESHYVGSERGAMLNTSALHLEVVSDLALLDDKVETARRRVESHFNL